MRRIVVLCFLVLAGCATADSGGDGQANARVRLAQAVNMYNAAAQAVLIYTNWPPCTPTSVGGCKNPEVVAQLKVASAAANEALDAATVAVAKGSPDAASLIAAATVAAQTLSTLSNQVKK